MSQHSDFRPVIAEIDARIEIRSSSFKDQVIAHLYSPFQTSPSSVHVPSGQTAMSCE